MFYEFDGDNSTRLQCLLVYTVFFPHSLVINCLLNPEACYLFITLVLLPLFLKTHFCIFAKIKNFPLPGFPLCTLREQYFPYLSLDWTHSLVFGSLFHMWGYNHTFSPALHFLIWLLDFGYRGEGARLVIRFWYYGLHTHTLVYSGSRSCRSR